MGFIPKQTTYTQNTYTPTKESTSKQEPAQEKIPPLEIQAYYKGKLVKKKGVVGPGKKTEGQPYTIYELIFNSGSKFDKKFSIFNDLSGKSMRIADLQEGETYKLLYNQEHGIDTRSGQPFKRNKLFFIGKIVPQSQGGIIQNPQNQQRSMEEYQYDTQGIQTQNMQPPYQKPISEDEIKLWENTEFGSIEEWLMVAGNSVVFNSEERAREIFNIMTQK